MWGILVVSVFLLYIHRHWRVQGAGGALGAEEPARTDPKKKEEEKKEREGKKKRKGEREGKKESQ